MSHFFINPSDKLRVRQIERKLKVPLPSVIRYCKELEEAKILKRIDISGIFFYTSESMVNFIHSKKLFNLTQIYDSRIIEYLQKELSNPVIIVFGSYSKGEDIESSDIDLYIESPSKTEISLEKFEKHLKRKIHIFRYKNINEVKNMHLANNILNGITLNGFVEVFK